MEDSGRLWELELWENESGTCPAGDFFEELKRRKRFEYERVKKLLSRFQKYSFPHLRRTHDIGKVVNEEMWEVRLSVGVEIRLLGIVKEDRTPPEFIAVHAFHKKDQKIRKSDIEKARDRIKKIK
jgi:hypothetical protein